MRLLGSLVAVAIIAAAASPLPAAAKCTDGKNRRVKIINDTSTPMTNMYGSNVGTDDWQEDVLGDSVLDAGETVSVNFDDGTCYCNFDFKAKFSDGTETVRRRFNVCTQDSWRVYDE